jgi:CHAT domain-containing protein
VSETRPNRGVAPSISPKLLNDLHRERRPLRVLLVASDTGGIPRVDQEVEDIRKLFVHNTKHLRTEVTVLKTADATLAAVSHELESGAYHIVHYAGHGEFVEQRTLEHRLVFRGTRDIGVPEYLHQTKLQGLWSKHRPSLFYMSCCRSAASGGTTDLVNNDLLGLMDAALCAGVPSAIGFRWPVSDHGAYDLALAFYDELLRTGRPDHALCAARARIYREWPEDPAWLSPVLVMQPP